VLLSSSLRDIKCNYYNRNLNIYLAPERYYFCNTKLRGVSFGRDRIDLGVRSYDLSISPSTY
jgi:hypothetical protein